MNELDPPPEKWKEICPRLPIGLKELSLDRDYF